MTLWNVILRGNYSIRSLIPLSEAQKHAQLTVCCLDIQTYKAIMKTKRMMNTKLDMTEAQRRVGREGSRKSTKGISKVIRMVFSLSRSNYMGVHCTSYLSILYALPI